MRRILLAGGTGLVGSQVLQHLALGHSNIELHIIARRPVNSPPAGVQSHVADIADWPALIARIAPEVAICCLGSTIKVAGSKEAFAAVDFDLVTAFAKASKAAGAKQMIEISSVGANAQSANFYLATKGKAESALQALSFDRLDIVRPGLLRGNRSESRAGEALGITLSPFSDALMHGAFRRYRSVDSQIVARAIAALAIVGGQGEFIHENDAMTALAG